MLVAPQLEGSTYHRREPEKEVLYQVVADNLETFLELVRTEDHGMPAHVENELRRYLECGILANGFVRLRCEDCGDSRVVAFSCKGRGFCPGCMGRRMADTAARLVDDVFPVVPVRQWVLSLPIELRYRLAYDGKLISDVLAVYLRAVNGWYRQQAKALGYTETRGGAVTFVQRFGSALNLNPHFHTLGLDGVYATDRDAESRLFVPTPEPTDEDVQRLTETIAYRVLSMLERRGVLEDSYADPLVDESPVLAGMTSASVSGLIASGDRAGRRVRRVLSDPAEAIRTAPLCFSSRGFSLHAATRVEAEDREHLERLCRYVARPPLAAGRLKRIDDERLTFALKTPWDDGTTHLILSPLELLEKLAALVPPPRVNLVRYHGVLAPHAKDRDKIVPAKVDEAEKAGADSDDPKDTPVRRRNRIAWALLLKRVWEIDVTVCDECGGRMHITASITDPASIRRYLDGVGLPSDPPLIAPARPPPQEEFDLCS